MKYVKKELPSYNLHMIQTDKFKSVHIEVIFGQKIKKDKITINNFLSTIMTYSTKKYNTKIKYARRLEELYAVSMYSNCFRLGNSMNIDFSMKILNDKYAEKGLLEKAIDFLYEVLFNPNVENNQFDKNSFNVIMHNEKSQIERFKEDQRSYAVLRLLELYNEDAPYSFNMRGYLDDLNKITPQSLYEYYKEFIKCNDIDIFVIGDIDCDYVEKIISNKIKFNNTKEKDKDVIIEAKKHREKPLEIIENDNTNQSKLNIVCSLENINEFEKKYVLMIYNIILGGNADSKFFKNIREKYSLCYYATSNANKLDNIMLISSGINKENYSKILILINKEMQDMREGIFSDEDVEKAKTYYISALEEVEDNPSQIISAYHATDKLGMDELEKRKEQIKKITKEDIISVANKVFVDTIFLLGGDKK